jgi:tripartite-type tricarboxylate transporter receptor subunit TctC
MKRQHRRSLILQFAAVTALVVAPWVAFAQTSFPTRPIKIVIGFAAGSSTDVAVRLIAQRMSQTLGQPVLVDNRAGASSNIAAKAVALAPPDGYTVFVGTIANTINVTFQPAASSDIGKDFMPVAMVASVPNLLVVHPSLGVDTLQQLIALAKKEPGKIAYASSGTGTSPHLAGELFAMKAGIKILHVPYKGSSSAVSDLVAGQVQMMFSPASTVLPFIRSGQLKALASTGATRTQSAPDLATIAELGIPDFESSVWMGFMVPNGTPPDIVSRLQSATLEAQQDPQIIAQLKANGIDVVKAGPAEFGQLIKSEADKWAQVIKAGNIKPD